MGSRECLPELKVSSGGREVNKRRSVGSMGNGARMIVGFLGSSVTELEKRCGDWICRNRGRGEYLQSAYLLL